MPPNGALGRPPSGFLGGVGHALAGVAPTVQHAAVSVRPTPMPKGPGGDVQSGHGYGGAQAAKFKTYSPAYHQAIKAVYNAQPLPQKAAILRGVISHIKSGDQSYRNSPTFRSIIQAYHAEPPQVKAALYQAGVRFPSEGLGKGLLTAATASLNDIGNAALKAYKSNKALAPASSTRRGAGVGASILGPMFGGQKGAAELFKNAGNDLINLPGNTVQGAYALGKNLAEGHVGNALHMLVDPYVQMALNPGQAFYQHPVNSAIMLGGPEAAVGRAAGAVARSGALGDRLAQAASTARPALKLGKVGENAAPFEEARSYSPNVLTKSAQVAWENHLRKRGLDPHIARPAGSVVHAFGGGLHAKLNRIADEMTAVRQMAGRGERGHVTHVLSKAAPAKEVRNIVPHILQGAIRSPKTALADIAGEMNRIEAAMTGSRTSKTFMARAQLRDLAIAEKHPELIPQAFEAAAKIRPLLHQQDKVLVSKGLLDPEQALRSRLMPYAIAHMGAKPGRSIAAQFPGDTKVLAGLEHANGGRIHTQEIIDDLKANKVPDPAYVGHYPAKGEFWRFYHRYRLARGTAAGQKRTGEAFRTGNYDHTYPALVAQAARSAETVTKAQLHDKVVSRFGILKPVVRQDASGHMVQVGSRPFRSAREAAAYAHAAHVDDHGNPIPGRLELVPIALAPKGAMDAVANLQHPNELAHESGHELDVLHQAMREAKGAGANNLALIPKVVADRFEEQFKRTGSRSLGRVTQQFRRTVLPYSTHWMMQIGSEAALRGLVAGVLDPRNIVAGHQLMKRLTGSEEGRAALQEMVNATFYGGHSQLAIHNPHENPVVAGVKTAPVTKQILAAHARYADGVAATMYELEHQARMFGLGKLARRQIQEFTGHYQAGIKLQAENVAMLADKLKTDPALVAKFGREVDNIFGKYNKMSPKLRAMVQTATPFLPWYLNAAKFVLYTLPVKHPVASSLLASLRQTINQDVADGKKEPLNAFAADELGRISPFGIFNPPKYGGVAGVGADVAQQAVSTVLPQALGPIYNMAGVSSFGSGPLKGPHGYVKADSPEAFNSALNTLIETLLPGASKVREGLEGGVPAYGTSTLWNPQPKPGGKNAGQAGTILNRLFNPLYSFERAKGAKGAPGSSKFLLGGSSGGSSGGYLLSGGSSSGGYLLP